MDNQQRRLVRLGWAGGIIDGEGCVSFAHTNDPRRSDSRLLYPHFKLSNTSALLLDEFADILESEELAFWRGDANAHVRNPRHKYQGVIIINGVKRMLRFVRTMRPFVVVKRPQMALIVDYSLHRLARPYHSSVDAHEMALLIEMRHLNRRGTAQERSEANTPSGAFGSAPMIESVPLLKGSGGEAVRQAPLVSP